VTVKNIKIPSVELKWLYAEFMSPVLHNTERHYIRWLKRGVLILSHPHRWAILVGSHTINGTRLSDRPPALAGIAVLSDQPYRPNKIISLYFDIIVQYGPRTA
jgi:hypothetical protein